MGLSERELADRSGCSPENRAALRRPRRPRPGLGDGVMFHFPEPGEAVLSALELVDRTQAAVDVRARVGVNAGPVIFREGDYFGRTVNVAARIADYARPGEVVSDAVQEQAGLEGVDLRPIGPVELKGVKGEITLFSAARSAG